MLDRAEELCYSIGIGFFFGDLAVCDMRHTGCSEVFLHEGALLNTAPIPVSTGEIEGDITYGVYGLHGQNS